MTSLLSREGLRFLFRSEEGVVSRQTWWAGFMLLATVLIVLTLIWLLLRPWAGRGLDERAMIDARTIAAYIYLTFYLFSLFFLAVCYVYLSTKRLRTIAQAAQTFPLLPAGQAGLPLVLLLFFGAAHWLNVRMADAVPGWIVFVFGIAFALSVVWQIFVLGIRPDKV